MRRGIVLTVAMLACLLSACALNPPRIVSISPSREGTDVATNQAISISFDRAMRADTMRAAVQLSPDTPFVLRTRPGGDASQYEIIPLSVLQSNQPYTVSIDRPLDAHDNALDRRVQIHFRTGALSLSRKVGYLVGQREQPAFAVGIVDPHADSFLARASPTIVYRLSGQSQQSAILSFDWAPEGRRLALVQASRNAGSGAILIVDVSSGAVVSPGISGSQVYWSVDGTIVYLKDGGLRRFRPSTLNDVALTDPADGRVAGPVALSPDGRSVAYSTVDALGLNHLWIMNLDLRSRYRPAGLDDPADRPAWSPNGTKLAFRRITAGGPELWIYDLSASGASAYRRGGPLDITAAAWLSDNSTLFAATGVGETATLYRVNIFSAGEAGGVVKVTGGKEAPNGSTPNTPAYDRRVSFTGQVGDLPQIFVMNGDGSRPQQLTEWEADYPYTGTSPNWNPAG